MSAGTKGPSCGKDGGRRDALAKADKLLLLSDQIRDILLMVQEGEELFGPSVRVNALGGAQSLLDYCDMVAGRLWDELAGKEAPA